MNIETLNINDNRYPDILKSIPDAPKILYYIGNIDLLSTECVAIVGTRRASPYGRWAAYEISKKISSCNVTVVSGMAEGIDSQAHTACLDNRGHTIAVLGNGVDICYPKSNEKLYKRILENGLIISEYPPGFKAQSWCFPARNRIISGLSMSVIVVEGALKSGSIITANLALNQGREVYAVPGNINQPNSLGVNSLIRDGAMPILSLDDLCTTIGIKDELSAKRFSGLSSDEKNIVNCIKGAPGIDSDYISLYTLLPLSSVNALLIGLEMKGLIKSEGRAYYIN